LYRNAAALWALSARYQPADIDNALKYLTSAVANGCAPQDLGTDPTFTTVLKGDPRFEALCKIGVESQPIRPTQRIVNPLPD
jgi:hypothetical protein